MKVRALLAVAVAAAAFLVQEQAAWPAPRAAIYLSVTPYPGLPDPLSLSGLTPHGQYVLSGTGVSFSPRNEITADSTGNATSSLVVPGDTSPASVTVSVASASSPTTPIATTGWIKVGTPHLLLDTDRPWPMRFAVYGFAAGEPLDVTYSDPRIAGPSTITAAQTATLTWTNLSGSPSPTAVPFAVTVTGRTYGRTLSASGVLPADQLAAGQSLAVDPARDDESVLLATPTQGSELLDENGSLEIESRIIATSITVGPSGIEAPVTGCSSASLAMQTDGNLVLSCVRRDAPSTLWTSGTAGTGRGNRLVLHTDGTMAVVTATGRVVWSSTYGRIWPSELDRGQSLTHADQLVDSPADPRWHATVNAHGALAVSGWGNWVSPAAGAGARLTLLSNGNLVLRTATGHTVWTTGTSGSGATRLVMQEDGNLTLRNGRGAIVWGTWTNRPSVSGNVMWDRYILSSDGQLTNGRFSAYLDDAGRFVVHGRRTLRTPPAGNGAYLAVQSDGNMVLYTRHHRAVWATHTRTAQHNAVIEVRLTRHGDLVLTISGNQVWSSPTG